MTNIWSNLRERHLNRNLYSIFSDIEEKIAYFALYNLSRQIQGFLLYNPQGDKLARNDEKGRYYTCVPPKEKLPKPPVIWGLESWYFSPRILFIVEGVFDACRIHNEGYTAIAALSNDPENLKNWFKMIPRKKIAISDGDPGGQKLLKYGDIKASIITDKDLGDLTDLEVSDIVKNIL